MKTSDSVQFGATAKWLHWIVAVLLILMLVAGRTLENLPVEQRAEPIMGHAGIGIVILLLMLFRLAWRFGHPPPGPVPGMGPWQPRLSHWMHGALYLLVILQALFGIGQALFLTEYPVVAFGVLDLSALAPADAGLERVFHVAHGANANLLLALVIGHAGAALYHHFVRKDEVLRRMLPGVRVRGD
jgi:cytochrome b561